MFYKNIGRTLYRAESRIGNDQGSLPNAAGGQGDALSPPASPWQSQGGGLGGKALKLCILQVLAILYLHNFFKR